VAAQTAACKSGSNKGGGPRVPLALGRKSIGCLSSLIWPKCRIPEGSAGELPWAPHVWRLRHQIGFVVCNHVFFDCLLLGGSDVKLCYRLPSWDMSFSAEVRGGEWYGSRDPRTMNGSSSLCVDDKFSW
jgi:hypothetical protein